MKPANKKRRSKAVTMHPGDKLDVDVSDKTRIRLIYDGDRARIRVAKAAEVRLTQAQSGG